jgi:hypothetical protein
MRTRTRARAGSQQPQSTLTFEGEKHTGPEAIVGKLKARGSPPSRPHPLASR